MTQPHHQIYSPPEPPTKSRPMPSRNTMRAVIALLLIGILVVMAVVTLVIGGEPGKVERSVIRPSEGSQADGQGAGSAGSRAEPAPNVWTARPQTDPAIDDEKTDRRRLSLDEVFPRRRITLAGRTYTRDKTSTTSRCDWTAWGVLATTLANEDCRMVVRATFFDTEKKFAVTAGVAAMPGSQAAQTSSMAGAAGERSGWFRGMRGRTAENIDEASGQAAGAVKGRYIIFAFATYFDGHRPAPADPVLAQVSRDFVGYTARPIDRRTKHED